MVKIAYVDSSVLVKHYVENEAGSSFASKYITTYKVYASSIVQVEVFSALSRKLQMREISNSLLLLLIKSWHLQLKGRGLK